MPTIHVQQLGKPPLEQGLLNQALAFFNAASRCEADIMITPSVTNSPLAPAIVCYAFSLELYLKLLHVLATGAATKGHKLDELFLSLPPNLQTELAALYPHGELVPQLSAVTNAFIEWRYGHEHGALAIDPRVLTEMARSCHKLVRRIRPELKVFGENMTVTITQTD
jgi:HEPN domain-containing protein